MRLGIIGLPQSGKTTVFNALTGGEAPLSAGSSYGQEMHVAAVKVPDERLDRLTEMFRPRKTIPAEVQYTDFPGVGFGSRDKAEAAWVGQLRTMDALVEVVRVFEDERVPHEGPIDPAADLEKVHLDMIVSDLAMVERRLQRLEADLKRTRTGERAPIEAEIELFQQFQDKLEAGTPIRDIPLTEDQERAIRGFQFLSAKPILVVANLWEEQIGEAGAIEARLSAAYPHQKTAVASLSGKIEMELAQLSPEDAETFMADLGITELAAGKVIRRSYDLTGLISFLTVGEDEVRAWPVVKGTKAPPAAGAIHGDLEKGFIRAEVVAYDDLIAAGSLAEARRRGLLRQEGRNYVVQDGDVINILFSR
ncbi:MAG: redox-regulated ATPase YchF [Chloroflexi bacterium]|nr:redox-regulated ATPase YchF [Chloroflexota bacterium]